MQEGGLPSPRTEAGREVFHPRKRLVRTTGGGSLFGAQKDPEKGPAAVSEQKGQAAPPPGPWLPLPKSQGEASWTLWTLVDTWCKIPLSAIKRQALVSPETGASEEREPWLLSIRRHIETVW